MMSNVNSMEVFMRGLSFGQIALRLHHFRLVIWDEVHRLRYYDLDKAQADEQVKRSHCDQFNL